MLKFYLNVAIIFLSLSCLSIANTAYHSLPKEFNYNSNDLRNDNDRRMATIFSENNLNEKITSSFSNTENRIDFNSQGSLYNEPLIKSVTTESGLIFEKEFEFRWENNSYIDIIQLLSLSNKAQALQFRLLVNKASDDSTILIFENIQKGADVADSSWVLDYNVFRGVITPSGASVDEISVLLYNVNQNNGLPPGDYSELLKINYRVVDLPDIRDSVKSSIKISNALASTYQGYPIDIEPSRDEFKVFARVPVVYPDHGIIFEMDTVYQFEDDSYTEIIQLKDLSAKAQALQFQLSLNKEISDNTILTFQNIQKGSDISDPSWVLDYNVFRGSLTVNGGSVDEVYVLLYNLNQNNGLPEGDYDELLKVKYRIANLEPLQDSIKSSIVISNALASTYQGYPINITPSRDKLTVIARNRVGFYGDVNGDGCIDVLDIIMVVDHIIGSDSLDALEFERGDIAPWFPGSPAPYPDGFVNVLDLAVLQDIILTGVYPDGTPIHNCRYVTLPKLNSTSNNKVTFYIYSAGITTYLNSEVDIVGVQIEFGDVSDNPGNMIISTALGQGYYMSTNELLKVLLYDRQGSKVIEEGNNILADMPFDITTPQDITIQNLILIDVNRQKLTENEYEIVYGIPPNFPTDYRLYQNYPNPFNSTTTIRFSIPEGNNVSLKVYDILGSEIETLINEEKSARTHEIKWNAANLPSGVYFYQLKAGDYTSVKKMILMK